MDRSAKIKICLLLLAISIGVRLLVWQSNKIAIAGVQYSIVTLYLDDTATLLSGDLRTFLSGPDPPSDATILTHPPGYSLLIAPVAFIFGDGDAFRIFQIFLNSFSAVMVFLIALLLFDRTTAIIGGILTAFSPQLAYYSGVLLPDGTCTLPILFAVYIFARAVRSPGLILAVICGVSLGVSCWLRSNAMLMPLFFAVFSLLSMPKPLRIRFAAALLTAFVVVIAPITIRNFIVYRSFIPLSLGMGHMIVIGFGNEDREGKLGLPTTDEGEMALDARRDGRSDYNDLYRPNGIARERDRLKLGLTTIRAHPLWYLQMVAHRGLNMFRVERVPVIAPERDERNTTNTLLYYLNIPLKYFQQLFITAVLLPLAFAGIILVFQKKEQRLAILVLLIVPVYYICIQSLIYTEYRFTIAMLYSMLIFAAAAIAAGIRRLGFFKESPSAS